MNLLGLGLCLGLAQGANADIYRSLDEHGVPLFSDRPPHAGATPYLVDRSRQTTAGTEFRPVMTEPEPESSPPAVGSATAETGPMTEKSPAIPARAMAWRRMRSQAGGGGMEEPGTD